MIKYYTKKGGRYYIGVVFMYNNLYYCAPQIKNNMIPTPKECLIECLSLVNEVTYKNLLQEQITYLNDYKKSLLGKVKQFRKRYQKGYLNSIILKRCCNFCF